MRPEREAISSIRSQKMCLGHDFFSAAKSPYRQPKVDCSTQAAQISQWMRVVALQAVRRRMAARTLGMLLGWLRDDDHLWLSCAELELSDLKRATWEQDICRPYSVGHGASEKHRQLRVHQKRARTTKPSQDHEKHDRVRRSWSAHQGNQPSLTLPWPPGGSGTVGCFSDHGGQQSPVRPALLNRQGTCTLHLITFRINLSKQI